MGRAESACGPILCVVGARPNFMKMAPLLRALNATPGAPPVVLVHTGQHYDHALSDQLFADLGLPVPDVNLEVGSASHAVQTAEVMKRFEPVLDSYSPSLVVVVGDVNSTLACALVASKKGVAVAHVEAGLRSYDRSMPEEINRVLTDQIADLLYTTEREAEANLAREGIAAERVAFVGNLMIDSLRAALPRALPAPQVLSAAGVDPDRIARGYALLTLHRPSNVDDPAALTEVLAILESASRQLSLVWPVHPRTRAALERQGGLERLAKADIVLLEPQGYREMVGLMAGASLVLTDSGGVQEESTALGVPCLTMRENTERPITISEGTNTLVGRDGVLIDRLIREVLATGGKRGRVPEGWDGEAAPRIARHMVDWVASRVQAGGL